MHTPSNPNPPRLEDDHLQTFIQPKPRWHQRYRPVLMVAGFLFGMGLIYGILNAPALLRIQPLAVGSYEPAETEFPSATPTTTPADTEQPSETPSIEQPTITPEEGPLPNNTVAVTALGVSAPIIWHTPLDDRVVYKNLEKGVIHLDGTPPPGHKGFSVLFGHSSNLPWAAGSYNTVFAPLLRIQPGATVLLTYNNVTYTYRVTRTFEVQPHQVEVLNSSQEKAGVRLITCTPLGTSLRRLVVEAEQISPDPSGNASYTQKTFSGQLPADR